MQTQIKTIHGESKGKGSSKATEATEELQFLMDFNASITTDAAKAMEHLTDFVFIMMENLTLACRDAYLNHMKNGIKPDTLAVVFSKYPFWWDRVGINFSGRVPGYSRRWAIIGDTTKIYTFTNLKHTQIMGSNHLLYFSSTTFFAFKTVVRHRRNVNQEKISVHSKHGCVHKGGVT